MANNKSLQFLRGTQSQISSSTEVALAGQPVYATDTNQLYIGDGSTQIKNLIPVNTEGSYPTLGAGHLQDFLVENTAGTSGVGWWHILSIPSSKLSTQGAYSLIFLINEVYDRAEGGQGQSGLLEIDLQTLSSNNGISYAGVNILGGNLSSSQICITFNSLQADVYYYLDSLYEAIIWTRLSEGLEAGQVEPRYNINTSFYGTSAPSGAVYAVVRNNASADEDGNNIVATYARQKGNYPTLGAGTAEIANRTGSIVIQNNADLNDCTANINEVQVYTCPTNATAATLANCPVVVTFTMWASRAFEESSTSFRDFQFLIATNNQCYYRVRSGGTTWANWRTLVESDGNYPTLGAGYLAKNGIINALQTSQIGWWKVFSVPISALTSISVTSAYSILIEVNGVYDEDEGSGSIEVNGKSNSSLWTEANCRILSGNLIPNNFAVVVSSDGANLEFYAYAESQWTRLAFTVTSEYYSASAVNAINWTLSFSNTSAPSVAVYAVNRNIAAKGVTPATSSDSDDVATTEWVRDSLISIGESITDSHIIATTTTCFTGPTGKLCTTRGSAIVSDLCGDNESIYSCSAITANLTVSTTADKKGVSLSYVTTSKGGNDGTGTVTAKFTYRKATLGELGQLIADTIG